ncbi:hypothetical protein BCR23_08250 [Enterococcus quebecensis]|uniref:Uncharacterized protein n=1 Tax=Enterococcus quebecensis TaxID=903983 RepID=A0A1E5GRV7_9ENTE|nr:hypothetical protein BCR23_08250 [Enterococcus quebecensis]
MKKLLNYYRVTDKLYNESSYKIKITINVATFITALLIKKILLENVDDLLSFIMGVLSFLMFFPLYSYLFYRLEKSSLVSQKGLIRRN